MKIAVIIPVFNRRETTIACLRQLTICLKGDNDFTFVVVDDGSTDGTQQAVLDSFPKAVVLKGEGDLWWTGAVEMGRSYSIEHKFTHILIVNDDLEFASNFFPPLVEASLQHPNSLIGSIKIDVSDHQTVLCSGYFVRDICKHFIDFYVGSNVREIQKDILKVDAIAGATLLMPVSVARDIGSFNTIDFPHNLGDLEYTYRANQSGYHCYTATQSRIFTEPNPNYLKAALYNTTRKQFIKNLLDSRKLAYGLIPTFKRAYLGKNMFIGTFCLFRSYASLGAKILYKLFIWETFLDVKRKNREHAKK